MEENLREYIEALFSETAPTRKAVELKEEMLQNLIEKYNDLINEGKTPQAAYNIAVAGIGDVSILLNDIINEAVPEQYELMRRRSAMLTAAAVAIYILCWVPLTILSLLFSSVYATIIGLSIMVLAIAAATGILIYNNMTKPKFPKSDSLVEDFREWQSGEHDKRTLRRSISSALWSIITVLYFIISFTTGSWQITWVVFVIGAAIEAFINIAFALKK